MINFTNLDYEGINLDFYQNDFRYWDKNKEIAYNQNLRYRVRQFFFQMAYDYLAANFIEGDYFEFGCHKARTFRISLTEARRKNFNNMSFIAFDSFEGLPAPSEIDSFPMWEQGALKTSEDVYDMLISQHGLFLDKIEKVKGYYKDTLNENLTQQFLRDNKKIAIAYIDCDFYESAKDVLSFIVPFLQDGSLLCLDDWNLYKGRSDRGEKRAFYEWKESVGDKFIFEDFLPIGWMGKSFIVNTK